MAYQWGVFDNERLANTQNHPKLANKGWHETALFDTYDQAKQYAIDWLGQWHSNSIELKPNVVYDYSGYNDTICIKPIKKGN